jgi:hypothetical protein
LPNNPSTAVISSPGRAIVRESSHFSNYVTVFEQGQASHYYKHENEHEVDNVKDEDEVQETSPPSFLFHLLRRQGVLKSFPATLGKLTAHLNFIIKIELLFNPSFS